MSPTLIWSILIAMGAFFVLRWLWKYLRENWQIARQGGMAAKYRELIDLVCRTNPSLQVVQIGSRSITYKGSQAAGPVFFTLWQSFGELRVEWRLVHPTFGKRTYRWEFPEQQDQQQMYARMKADLEWTA